MRKFFLGHSMKYAPKVQLHDSLLGKCMALNEFTGNCIVTLHSMACPWTYLTRATALWGPAHSSHYFELLGTQKPEKAS